MDMKRKKKFETINLMEKILHSDIEIVDNMCSIRDFQFFLNEELERIRKERPDEAYVYIEEIYSPDDILYEDIKGYNISVTKIIWLETEEEFEKRKETLIKEKNIKKLLKDLDKIKQLEEFQRGRLNETLEEKKELLRELSSIKANEYKNTVCTFYGKQVFEVGLSDSCENYEQKEN